MSDLFKELKKDEEQKIDREENFSTNYSKLEPLISRFDKYLDKVNDFELDILIEKEYLQDFPYKDNFLVKEGVLYASEKEVIGEYNDPELKKIYRKAVKFDGLPVGLKINISNPTIRTNVILTILGSSCLILFRKAVTADVSFETNDDFNEIVKSDDNFRTINEGMFEIEPNKFSDLDIENSFRYLLLKNPTLILSEVVNKKVTENPTCYIATMIYRDINHKNISELRYFRDNYLMKNKFGRYFINLYYKYSHRLVDKYEDSNIVKNIVIHVLDFIIPFIKLFNIKRNNA